MDLHLDENDPEIDSAFANALRLAEDLMGLSDVPIICTRDFVGEVRAMTMSPQYGSERGAAGQAVGKTITTTTGEVVGILDRSRLETEDLAVVERTMAHECGHVMIARRGDTLDEAKFIRDVPQRALDVWEVAVVLISAYATDEYRCESAVYERNYAPDFAVTVAGIEQTLRLLNRDSLNLLDQIRAANGYDPAEAIKSQVLATTNETAVWLACLAAQHLHLDQFDPARLTPVARAIWEKIVGPVWDDLLAFYATVPTALQPWSEDDASAATTLAARQTQGLISGIGITARGIDTAVLEVTLSDLEIKERRDLLTEAAGR